MARPLRVQYPGAIYRISHQGTGRQQVFRGKGDRISFLDSLEKSAATHGVKLFGFVLMDRTFQLLVQTPRGNLSNFMRQLNIRYTSYFNKTHRRSGNLFRGRFKSLLIQDSYLDLAGCAMHLSPAQTRLKRRMENNERWDDLRRFGWSSLPGHLGRYPRYPYVDHSRLLANFGGDTPQGRERYGRHLMGNLDQACDLTPHTRGQAILGDKDFLDNVTERAMTFQSSNQHKPLPIDPEHVLLVLEQFWQSPRSTFLTTPSSRRMVAIDFLYRHCRMTNPAIGDLFELHYSTVSSLRNRLISLRQSDKLLDGEVLTIERSLSRSLSN